MIGNFLSNALKFTERGSVVLTAHWNQGVACFEVQDTGMGLDERQMQRLFEPFTQLDGSSTRKFEGTGLGLTICRQLARLMGGEVGVRSAPGQGSTFWMQLPLQEADLPQGHHQPPQPGHSQPNDIQTLLAGVNVLVAEDNPTNRFLVKQMLERAGAVVTCVDNGSLAVVAFARSLETNAEADSRIDLVLMDVHMPELDGLEATRRIREWESTAQVLRRVPILAMTAGVLLEERDAVTKAGMDGFISKPMTRDTLLAAVKAHT